MVEVLAFLPHLPTRSLFFASAHVLLLSHQLLALGLEETEKKGGSLKERSLGSFV